MYSPLAIPSQSLPRTIFSGTRVEQYQVVCFSLCWAASVRKLQMWPSGLQLDLMCPSQHMCLILREVWKVADPLGDGAYWTFCRLLGVCPSKGLWDPVSALGSSALEWCAVSLQGKDMRSINYSLKPWKLWAQMSQFSGSQYWWMVETACILKWGWISSEKGITECPS